MSAATIQRYERGDSGQMFKTVRSLCRALERGGAEFLEATKECGPGLALRDE